MGYADKLDIVGRSKSAVEEALLALENAAKYLGLPANIRKTKYIIVGLLRAPNEDFVQIGLYSIKQVDQFL